MDIQRDSVVVRRISWGSVIAGVVTAIALSLLFTTLGTSLGLSMLQPKADDVVNGADKAVLAWSVISVVISLACGGFIAGRLAGTDGTVHGFLSWATSLIVASVLGFMAVGGALNMAGSAVGSVASATGSAVSGIGSVAAKAAGGTADMAKNLSDRLGFDTKLTAANADDNITEALRKSGVPELQPDYLQSQLQAAGNDVASAVKDLAVSPDSSDAIFDKLGQKLKARVDTVSQSVSRDDVKNALAQNTSMTPEEADKAVDNFIKTRDTTVTQAKQRLDELQGRLNEAKVQYAELKKEAIEKADQAASAGARLALWSFIALLIGAVVSAFAGLWGVNTHPEYRRIRA
ncbi:CAP-Gly protein (plasmid) [Erwinia sp. E602]|uniref:TIGR04086 family membrane protein n=1 Tax=unclassified Erwinia TaxID=2622719 RepID=UPI0006FCE623|nr:MULTISPECIES: TIGR04086 family membrane protein [unclassified Erwinia]KQN55414.1 CAP-Gly protein [Erwinia sp. Leaf53]QUG73476.1 CAP-Gly protein [Erwinia sp. E602]